MHGLRHLHDRLSVGRDHLRVPVTRRTSALRLRTLLSTYASAGGRDACLLFTAGGGEALARYARRGRGLPARVVPVEIHNMDAVGLDLWLAALAWGAVEVISIVGSDDLARYDEPWSGSRCSSATRSRRRWATRAAFPRGGRERPGGTRRALWDGHAPLGVRDPATFAATAEKRTTIGLALDHLAQHAPAPQSMIALPKGAPFGAICDRRRQVHDVPRVRRQLPGGRDPRQPGGAAGALHRANCVQCGICEETCPEHAIALTPRLDLTRAARSPAC